MGPCAVLQRKRWDGIITYGSGCVVFFLTVDSRSFSYRGSREYLVENTVVSLGHFEFQISETVSLLFSFFLSLFLKSVQLSPSIRQPTHAQIKGDFQLFVFSCLKTKSTRLHFWFKWVICIEKFISTGHKDMVVKEGSKNFNYDRILKVAVNWRQAAEWPLQSDFLGWDC